MANLCNSYLLFSLKFLFKAIVKIHLAVVLFQNELNEINELNRT